MWFLVVESDLVSRIPNSADDVNSRDGKKIRARGYPRIKSVMGTGRVAKRVPADIINGYLTTR